MFLWIFLSLVTEFCAPCSAQFFGISQFNQMQPAQANPFNQFPQFGGNDNFNFPGASIYPQQPTNNRNPYPNQQISYPQQPINSQIQYPNSNQQRPYQNPQPSNNQQGTSQNFRPTQGIPLDQKVNAASRISEKKCSEYSYVAKEPGVPVGGLSLYSEIQNIDVDNCVSSIGLVVGGENATKGEFPHMAALGYGFVNSISFKCGGSLISERYVLSAAHCRSANRLPPSVVRLGDLNLKVRESDLPEMDVPVEQFIAHENYNPRTKHNDIAVVKLTRNVEFSKKLRPACLALPETPLREKVTASGWGFLGIGEPTADILQKVNLKIIPLQECKNLYKEQANKYNLNNDQLCAGELAGGKDTCGGDSGGPLQIVSDSNKCMFIIVGITSYGPSYCGIANQPGIYTKVSAHLDWIEAKVWGR